MDAETQWQFGRRHPELNSKDTKTRFQDYVVVVAGGCSGIGRACVDRFLNDGATVYGLDIRIQNTEGVKEEYGDKIEFIECDVSNNEQCKQVISQISSKHENTVHTLVNCAAYFGSKGLDFKRDDFIKSFDVNVIGYANTVQAAEPFMKANGMSSVINLGSISGARCQPDRWTYSATKGAIDSMTRCMALDLREKKIRVNSVLPSWVWTREVAKACDMDREKGEKLWGNFFMDERLGDVEEIAAAIVFLASKDASLITGTNMHVDGGYLAMGPEQLGAGSKFAGSKY